MSLHEQTPGRRQHPRTPDQSRGAWSRVPQVTALFWVIKILTTGMGETTSDFLAHGIGPVITVLIGAGALVAALLWQFSVRRYQAWPYWTAVAMVSVFGTMAADVLHIGLGIPYAISTSFYVIVLAVVFAAWYRSEGTLSIHSVYTRRREGFYWAAVLATFALGTAAGDLTATTLHLGYFASGVLFAVLFALPGLAYWRLGLDPILAFWLSYIMTRPLGASFADWLAVPPSRGGLDIGAGTITLVLAVLVVGLVGYLARTRRDVEAA